MKALLVGIKLTDNIDFDETLLECKNLCFAANIEIIETLIQSSNSLDPNFALRSGKLAELKKLIKEKEAELVVFYNNLNTKTVSNLMDYLEIKVIDRTALILQIFELRARSKEAKIQTKIAQLRYNLPQALKENMDSDKKRGGTVKNRGAGETRATIIKRKMEGEINALKEELRKLEKRKEIENIKRNKSDLKRVALVGYTNAGKSSLMNNLLKRNEKEDKAVLEKDQLFATLDTSVRNIKYKKHEFLLYDTVGFVSNLPHDLIEAFKSTLKAASYADLLIQVIDGSSNNHLLHEKVTLETLKQINADKIDMINVYNKCDLIKDKNINNGLYISCTENIGIDELLEKIDNALYPKTIEKEILIPYDKLGIIKKYAIKVDFKIIENNEQGALYLVSTDEETLKEIENILNK